MALHLYGLVLRRNAGLVPRAIEGLSRSSVRVLPCDGLGALVSDVPAPAPAPGIEDLRIHDAVLRDVVAAGVTAAASRFGQTFPDDAAACRELAEHGQRVAALLEQHDGCVEMRVLISGSPGAHGASAPPRAAGADATPGRAYLERLREAAQAPRVSLRAAIGPIVRRERVELLPRGAGVAVAHLIRRADEPAWRAAVQELPGLAMARLVGPLPLYSFATANE